MPASSRPRILIIDDDPLFRSLLVAMLRKDYLVSVASDGTEGFNKALQYPPQLAVMDVQMPGWDGLRTLKAFRSHQALSNIPVIMLTADSTRATVMAAIQEGANDYVIKTSLCRDDFLRKTTRLLNAGSLTPKPSRSDQPPEPAHGRTGPALPDPKFFASCTSSTATARQIPGEPTTDPSMMQALIDNWE